MGYVYGSAAVIGLQMVPVLEPLPGMADVAAVYARDLGVAFQLANFIRDVGEDLRRGRIYLPTSRSRELRRHAGEHLEHGVVDGTDQAAARVRDRPYPRDLPLRGARGQAAPPDQQGLHPHRDQALRRHPRRGREGRLPGARPPGRGSGCRAGSASPCPVSYGPVPPEPHPPARGSA